MGISVFHEETQTDGMAEGYDQGNSEFSQMFWKTA